MKFGMNPGRACSLEGLFGSCPELSQLTFLGDCPCVAGRTGVGTIYDWKPEGTFVWEFRAATGSGASDVFLESSQLIDVYAYCRSNNHKYCASGMRTAPGAFGSSKERKGWVA